jgi:tetratricopeptide (TPR) repeat protein
MKALAKERERRYDSAIGLANDIERFTSHEPVSAGPPTAGYRMRKFVRRNRGQVMAASLVLLALVVGMMGTTLGLLEARRQERRAIVAAEAAEKAREAEANQKLAAIRQERLAAIQVVEKEKARKAEAEQRTQAEKRLTQIEKANEILGSIFKDLDPENAEKNGKPLTILLGERLDQASAQIEGDAIGDPLAVARMQMTLGQSQRGLGYAEKAIGLFARARDTFTARLGLDHTDTLASMNNLAVSYFDAGKSDRALKLHAEVLAIQKTKLGPDHPLTLNSMSNLALSYHETGQRDLSLRLNEETLALRRAKLGPDHPDTLQSMNNLARDYEDAGQRERALKLYEETPVVSG